MKWSWRTFGKIEHDVLVRSCWLLHRARRLSVFCWNIKETVVNKEHLDWVVMQYWTIHKTNMWHQDLHHVTRHLYTWPNYHSHLRGSTSVCNPRIPNPGIPAVCANPESRDWPRLNPGITGLQKFVKWCIFWVSNDTNNNSSPLVNKIFGYHGYQNSDHSVSLILKRDPGITNFSIPNPGIENSILGLQSLGSTRVVQ